METDFYEGLRKYVYVVLNRGSYGEIETERKNLGIILKEKFFNILKVQLILNAIVFLLAPGIIKFLGFEGSEITGIFRITLWASFFQVIFLMLEVILWYLELYNESLLCVTFFAVSNAALNYILVFHTNAPVGTGLPHIDYPQFPARRLVPAGETQGL